MRGAGHQFPVLQPSPGFPAVMPGAGIGMFPSTSVMGIPPAALSMPPGAASFPVQQPMYPMPIMQVRITFLHFVEVRLLQVFNCIFFVKRILLLKMFVFM
jgi:hypothetical protein